MVAPVVRKTTVIAAGELMATVGVAVGAVVSAAAVDLTVLPYSMSLRSEMPRFALDIEFERAVDADRVKAKLKKASEVLKITLPFEIPT